MPSTVHVAQLDLEVIEAVVSRILQGKVESGADGDALTGQTDREQRKRMESISFDDAVAAMGAEGFDAVAGTLEMFRENKNF